MSDYTDGGLLRVSSVLLQLLCGSLVPVILLQAVDFEVPILQFGIRPGDQEPSVFAAVRRGREAGQSRCPGYCVFPTQKKRRNRYLNHLVSRKMDPFHAPSISVIHHTSFSEIVIVALPGSVLRDRHSTPAPSSLMTAAPALLSVNQELNDFVFSSNVRNSNQANHTKYPSFIIM